MSFGLHPYRDLPEEDIPRKSTGRFIPAGYQTPLLDGRLSGNLHQRPVNQWKAHLLPWRVRESGCEQDLMNERTEKLNLLFSVARHDISNELSALQLYLDILLEDHPDDRKRDYYRKFSEGFDRISSILGFMRDYLDMGMQASIWHDLGSLVSTAAGSFSGSPVKIMIDIPQIEIYADPMIERVFYNLIDNAVRYGGTISRLTFTTRCQESGIMIICEDDGIGIPAEQKEQIFRKGYGENTGLGLFFAREILRNSGITIRENGAPGTGARFEIFVPVGKFRVAQP